MFSGYSTSWCLPPQPLPSQRWTSMKFFFPVRWTMGWAVGFVLGKLPQGLQGFRACLPPTHPPQHTHNIQLTENVCVYVHGGWWCVCESVSLCMGVLVRGGQAWIRGGTWECLCVQLLAIVSVRGALCLSVSKYVCVARGGRGGRGAGVEWGGPGKPQDPRLDQLRAP